MMKKIALFTLVLCAIATVSQAALMVNVRLAAGQTNIIDTVGQIVNLEIYATLPAGTTAPGAVSISYGLKSTEDAELLAGNIANVVRGSIFNTGSAGASHAAYDAVGGTDWGGTIPGTSTTGFATAGTLSTSTGVWDAVKNEAVLGTFQWVATAVPSAYAETEVSAFNMIKAVAPDFLYDTSFNYWANGVNVKSTLTAYQTGTDWINPGATVTLTTQIVPEPSTLVLLGMSCLALLAYRRRK